jgi:hypothetical protein
MPKEPKEMQTMRWAVLTLCLSAALAAGCHDDEVCNPGLMLEGGVCIPIVAPPDAGSTTTDGGGVDATDASAADATGP